MRSADLRPVLQQTASLAIVLALAGCAGVGGMVEAARDKAVALVTPSPAASASASAASAPAARAAAAPTPAASGPAPVTDAASPEADRPVPPAAQRAFDDALRALRAGRHDEAEKGLLALTQLHPSLGGPHANLGLIHRQAGRLPEAVAALEAAVKASPRQPAYWNQLGVSYRMAGQFAKARDAYERAIELDAQYAAAQLNLGILFDLYLAEPARALEQYERYLALTPAGDANVTKWVADLKNRKPQAAPATQTSQAAPKEKP
jgi:tetratricopeptide (TPR) repeat protein